tara:strand:- start:983 stop:1633 length:651 start_codon:yes stop_codon:yes gene_type:complete
MTKKYKKSELPTTLPVFPLPGAIILPFGSLPLNIFEPRYVAMIEAVLGGHRMIGMIQPITSMENQSDNLYPVGCAGKIISFTETADGRFLIELNGILRFRVKKEIGLINGYRNIVPNWDPYIGDLKEEVENIDISELLKQLRIYFEKNNINVDFSEISKISAEQILASVPQICSFKQNEKQAILEAISWTSRVEVIVSLLKMYSSDKSDIENESIN